MPSTITKSVNVSGLADGELTCTLKRRPVLTKIGEHETKITGYEWVAVFSEDHDGPGGVDDVSAEVKVASLPNNVKTALQTLRGIGLDAIKSAYGAA